jgi:O-antigen/teichoic acid export membrane protein
MDKSVATSVTNLTRRAKSAASPQRQLVVNIVANGGGYIFVTFVSAWFVPYLIHRLGVAAYGMIGLASSVTSYLSIITLSLNGAVGRYLTIDLERKDFDSANRTFNTSLLGTAAIILVLLPLVVAASLAVPRIFNVPAGQEEASKWLFAFVMTSFLVNELDSAFSVSSWARNRFDLRNIVSTLSQISRVGLIILLFSSMQASLWHVGLGALAATIFGLGGDIIIWRWLTPQLHIRLRAFDRSRVRQLFSMGGWLVVNQIGSLLFLNIALIMVNTLLGAVAAGQYSSILLFSTLLRGLAGTVGGILTPTILARFAQGDLTGMNRISDKSVKLMGLAVALPVGLICGLAHPLLQLWLGPDFVPLAGLLVLLMWHLCINLAVLPLFGLQVAFNRVKIPGIVTLAMGIMHVVVAVVFVKGLGWGLYGIAAAGALVLTLKNAVFTPIYGALIQKLPWWTFLWGMAPGQAGALVLTLGAYAGTRLLPITNWFSLLAIGAALGAAYLALAYLALLNAEDRQLLWSLVPFGGQR